MKVVGFPPSASAVNKALDAARAALPEHDPFHPVLDGMQALAVAIDNSALQQTRAAAAAEAATQEAIAAMESVADATRGRAAEVLSPESVRSLVQEVTGGVRRELATDLRADRDRAISVDRRRRWIVTVSVGAVLALVAAGAGAWLTASACLLGQPGNDQQGRGYCVYWH